MAKVEQSLGRDIAVRIQRAQMQVGSRLAPLLRAVQTLL